MPRIISPFNVHDAIQRHRAGESISSIAASIGISRKTLRDHMKRVGYSTGNAAPRRVVSRASEAAQLYREGLSVQALSVRFGVARGTVERWLRATGVPLRGESEAATLRMARLSPEERSALAAPAHEAVRGRVRDDDELARNAFRRFLNDSVRIGEGEALLCNALDQAGITYVAQLPEGRYNIDIAIGPLAVEVHNHPRHPEADPHHRKRIMYLLDAGWHVLYVWTTKGRPLTVKGVQQVITDAQLASRNPAALSRYRVIRGDGEPATRGRTQTYHDPLVPPAH